MLLLIGNTCFAGLTTLSGIWNGIWNGILNGFFEYQTSLMLTQYKKNCCFDLMFVTSQLKELLFGMLV